MIDSRVKIDSSFVISQIHGSKHPLLLLEPRFDVASVARSADPHSPHSVLPILLGAGKVMWMNAAALL